MRNALEVKRPLMSAQEWPREAMVGPRIDGIGARDEEDAVMMWRRWTVLAVLVFIIITVSTAESDVFGPPFAYAPTQERHEPG